MVSKWNKTSVMIFLYQKTPRRLGVQVRRAKRRPQGWRARPGSRAAPRPYGPLVDPLTQIFLLYILLYPKKIQESHETTFPLPQPSVPVISHLGAFSGAPPEGASIMDGFYINTIASPMKREQFNTDLRVHSQQLDGFFSLFDIQYNVLLDVLGVLSDVIFFCDVFVEIR